MIKLQQCGTTFNEMFEKYQGLSHKACLHIRNEICEYLKEHNSVYCSCCLEQGELRLYLNEGTIMKKIDVWPTTVHVIGRQILERTIYREFSVFMGTPFLCLRDEYIEQDEKGVWQAKAWKSLGSYEDVSEYTKTVNTVYDKLLQLICTELVIANTVSCWVRLHEGTLLATISECNNYADEITIKEWTHGENKVAVTILNEMLTKQFGITCGETFTCRLGDVLSTVDPIFENEEKSNEEVSVYTEVMEFKAKQLCDLTMYYLKNHTQEYGDMFRVYLDDDCNLMIQKSLNEMAYLIAKVDKELCEIFINEFYNHFNIYLDEWFNVAKGGELNVVVL